MNLYIVLLCECQCQWILLQDGQDSWPELHASHCQGWRVYIHVTKCRRHPRPGRNVSWGSQDEIKIRDCSARLPRSRRYIRRFNCLFYLYSLHIPLRYWMFVTYILFQLIMIFEVMNTLAYCIVECCCFVRWPTIIPDVSEGRPDHLGAAEWWRCKLHQFKLVLWWMCEDWVEWRFPRRVRLHSSDHYKTTGRNSGEHCNINHCCVVVR